MVRPYGLMAWPPGLLASRHCGLTLCRYSRIVWPCGVIGLALWRYSLMASPSDLLWPGFVACYGLALSRYSLNLWPHCLLASLMATPHGLALWPGLIALWPGLG